MAQRYLLVLIFIALVFGPAHSQITSSAKLPRFQKHYVRERETPSSIASDFNIKTKDFLMLNNFPADVKLKPGQEVLIRQLKDGEPMTKESPYVPKQAAQNPSKAKEPVAETTQPKDELSETHATSTATESPSKPKKAPVAAKEEEIQMLTGPNGVKYQMTSGNFHVVQKGQTFYHIAMMYHLTMDELKKINNMTTTDIKVGQELKVSK